MIEHTLTASPCWSCGKVNDLASGVNVDTPPKPGDVTICIKCGTWNVYSDTRFLTLRKPTRIEATEIANDPTCARVKEAWRQVTK